MKRAAAVAALLLAGRAVTAPAQAAPCAAGIVQDHEVLAGEQIDTYLFTRRCGAVMLVDTMAVSTGGKRGFAVGAEVYRFRYPGSKGAVRTAPATREVRPDVAHVLGLWHAVPAQPTGYAGFVKDRIVVGNVGRVVALQF